MASPLPAARYSLTAQILHWAVALLILSAWLLPSIAEEMPKGPERTELILLHKSIGVGVLALVLLRLLWRQLSPPPAYPAGFGLLQRRAATGGHLLLYVLMLAVPVVGVMMSWANGRTVEFFGLFALPSLMAEDKALGHQLEEVHEFLGNGLLLIAGLHAVIALVHQFVMKDGTLSRMLPGRCAVSEPPSARSVRG